MTTITIGNNTWTIEGNRLVRDWGEDEIDRLGMRFNLLNHRVRLGITFARYLEAPEIYDAQVKALMDGDGLNIVAGRVRIVALPVRIRRGATWRDIQRPARRKRPGILARILEIFTGRGNRYRTLKGA
ncbi:MAG: hypothetical protein ABIJ95_11945 [Pseudomonadota bacterium]